MNISKYLKAKKSKKTFRRRSSLNPTINGRSSDFIAPGFATGCEMACTYCYVARHRSFGNPVEKYINVDNILTSIKNHYHTLDSKISNQCDPKYWTYDIGCNTDMLSPLMIDTTNKVVDYFKNQMPGAKPTFATKIANADKLDKLPFSDNSDCNRQFRIRYSFMPENKRKVLEPATSSIKARIKDIQIAYDKGYEVHLNFSPVVIYENWLSEYAELMQEIDHSLSNEIKEQLKCEVIFLTHHEKLHKSNLTWNEEAEKLLWRPDIQEDKITQRGNAALRYNYIQKRVFIDNFKATLFNNMPYCSIRYIF